MQDRRELAKVKTYFAKKLEEYGHTPRGVDWSSAESHELRFHQLIKIIHTAGKYSLLDYGSGYGAMYDYLVRLGHELHYIGFDITVPMVEKGRELHPNNPDCWFTDRIEDVPAVDYAVLCGAFNLKLDAAQQAWTRIILSSLHQMDSLARKGFSFNMLTKYSEADKMQPELYYGDPLFFFDYCKMNFSRNVSLLHDYNLYDFTILVRKDLP